jgi:hypothetical protein
MIPGSQDQLETAVPPLCLVSMSVPMFPPPTGENDRVLGEVPDAQGKAFAGTTGEWPSNN